jgi:hypothetical protein
MNKSQSLYFNIVLPAEYKLEKKVKTRLDKFANKMNKSKIMKWIAHRYVGELFYIYLLNKYKSRCFIRSTTLGVDYYGLVLYLFDKDINIQNAVIDDVAKQLANCIKRGIETIIIPLLLHMDTTAHANVLIYRKNNNTIEHFEPHGSHLQFRKGLYNSILDIRINSFMDNLNARLENKLVFEPASKTCPSKKGFQGIESQIKHTILDNGEEETGGYCAAWSMFFTELALQNPKFTSQELVTLILKSSQLKPEYMRKIIRGYVLNISEKLETYFTVFFGPDTNLEHMYKVSVGKEEKIVEIQNYIKHFIEIEMLLLNDHFDKETYKRILEDEIRSTQKIQEYSTPSSGPTNNLSKAPTNIFSRVYANFFSRENKAPPSLDKPTFEKELEILNIKKKIDKDLEILNIQKKILENIHILEAANESAKLNSPLKPIDIKELLKCPDGNLRDPQTGKCIKPKNKTKKEPKQKEPKQKEPEQKESEQKEPEQKEPEQKEPEQKEPEQKESEQKEPEQKEPKQKKPRVQKECKDGKTRNEKGRCVNPQNKTKKERVQKEPKQKEPDQKEPKQKEPQQKEPKQKECKDGKTRNDKGRCVKMKV